MKVDELLEEMQGKPVKDQVYSLFHFFSDLGNLTSGQSFLKRTIVMPPAHLREQLRKDFLDYEEVLTVGLLAVLRQGVQEGVLRQGMKRGWWPVYVG